MKKISLKRILILVLFMIMIAIYAFVKVTEVSFRRESYPYFPPSPTEEEIEKAKKLPKEDCPCWDSIHEICMPQAACI